MQSLDKCPCCGQRILIRFGIKFQPKKADILDMINNLTQGRGGIDAETLGWVFYPGESKIKAKQRIKAHICQINDMLVSTDYRIENGNGLYKVVNVSE